MDNKTIIKTFFDKYIVSKPYNEEEIVKAEKSVSNDYKLPEELRWYLLNISSDIYYYEYDRNLLFNIFFPNLNEIVNYLINDFTEPYVGGCVSQWNEDDEERKQEEILRKASWPKISNNENDHCQCDNVFCYYSIVLNNEKKGSIYHLVFDDHVWYMNLKNTMTFLDVIINNIGITNM